MKCQKCHFNNPDGMKFCGECGIKIEALCPECNFSNPPDFKFCGNCGHNLKAASESFSTELSHDEKMAKIQKYLPEGLTEKILAQRDRIEGKSIRTGHVINVYYNLVIAEVASGDLEMAKMHYEKGRSLVELAPNWWGPRYDFLKGVILLNEASPDHGQIEACFEKSIFGDESVGAAVPAAQTRYCLAKTLARKGEADRSFKMFTDLHSSFQNWDLFVWQQRCKQELEPYRF